MGIPISMMMTCLVSGFVIRSNPAGIRSHNTIHNKGTEKESIKLEYQ